MNKESDTSAEIESIECRLLLEAVYAKWGYDFRDYSSAHMKRRILRRLESAGLENIGTMQHILLVDRAFFESFLLDLSINVSEMFRDPSFFRGLRQKVLPELAVLPFIKIWHAGCATGEEVYSMAILLKEENLYPKCQIYATDLNEPVLKKAREGIYPLEAMKEYTKNYQKAGGSTSFSDYYTARYSHAIMDQTLKEKIVFADHNLVTDSVFGEMHLIVCRNVLIYFNKGLQNRVIGLFLDSLAEGGFLCLGSKESPDFTEYFDAFETVAGEEKIFRRKPVYGR